MYSEYLSMLVGITGAPGNATPPVIASAPTSLTATANYPAIDLGWTNGDTYTSIAIERKSTGDYASLAVIAGDQVSYSDSTIVAAVTYTYRVRGLKSSYPTPFSGTASAAASSSPVAATGSITVVDNGLLSGSSLTVGALVIDVQAIAGATAEDTANNIADAINQGSVVVDAAANNPVTLTASVAGSAGNLIVLLTDAAGLLLSGAHLTGGSD